MVDLMRVPYGQTVHGEEEVAAVVDVLRTSTQMGARVRRFEEQVSALFAKRHGIMVNSGSSALEIATELLALPEGAEVVTPVLTFATTVSPLVRARLVPSFVDVEPDTFNIDVDRIEAAITPSTRAIVVPSLIGNMPDWDQVAQIAKSRGLIVVEDSADTLGATLRGTSTGTRSDISTTSFYGSHVINCAGNGGMLCVNRDEWAEEARLLRSWGRSSSLFVESENIENRFNVDVGGIPYDAKFVFSRIGHNMEPSEIGAAFGLVQLDRLAGNIVARERNFARQLAFFREFEELFTLPRQQPDSVTGWLAFPLIVRDEAPFTRRDLQIHLEKSGIQTRTVFTGNILRQPGFAGVNHRAAPGGYPNADRVMRGGMLLGCHHGLSDAMLDHVHERTRVFLGRYR